MWQIVRSRKISRLHVIVRDGLEMRNERSPRLSK